MRDRLNSLLQPVRDWLNRTPTRDVPDALVGLRSVTAAVKPGISPESIPIAVFPRLLDVFKPHIAAFYVLETPTVLEAKQTFPAAFWNLEVTRRRFLKRDIKGFAIGRALDKREAIHIRASTVLVDRGEYDPFTAAIVSELIIPLFVDGRPIGVVVMSRERGNPFSDPDISTAHAVGVFLSGLYSHVMERATMNGTLAFLRQVSTLSLEDTDELLEGAFQTLNKLIPSVYSSLWLYNQPVLDEPPSLALRFFMPFLLKGKKITDELLDRRVISIDQSLSGAALTSRHPRTFDDIQTNASYANPNFAKRFRLEWFVSVPILAGADVLGVMNIYPVASRRLFDESLTELMQVLANQLATALRMAFLHRAETSARRYDPLLLELLRTGGRSTEWNRIARLISDELACEGCSIFLRKDNGRIGLAGTTGLIGDPPFDEVEYQEGEGLTGECYRRSEPIIHYRDLPGPGHDSHKSKYREKISTPGKSRSIILVPIRVRNLPAAGVIRCNNKDQSTRRHCGLFTREDGLLLSQVSETLADVNQKLDWARRMEQRHDRQIHDLHHEMLSPINGIYVLIEPLLERAEHLRESGGSLVIDEYVIRAFESIFEGAVQGSMVVKAIGALDDELLIQKKPVDLVDIVMTCKRWLKSALAHRRIEMKVGWLQRRRLLGDREQLQRLIYNLLGNAIKYRDEDETLRYIEIKGTESEDCFELTVEDNGIGVPAGEEESIFNRGVRGSNVAGVAPEGSGLGLAFCRKIAAAHGWEIRLLSRQKPTSFMVRIGNEVE